MREMLNNVILTLADYQLTLGGLMGCIFAGIVVAAIFRLVIIALRQYSRVHKIDDAIQRSIKLWLALGGLLTFVILCMFSLGSNANLVSGSDSSSITLRGVFIGLLLISIARVADKIISARLLEEIESHMDRDIYQDQYGKKANSGITRIIQYALFILVAIILLTNSSFDFSLYRFQVGSEEISITISKVLLAFFIILITRLLVWILVNIVLYGWYKREQVDLGKQVAYNQLLSYVAYFFAVLIALQYIGINLTLLWAGAAVLLVGVGIALQQVISDFFSGLVILFERSVEVGDFLDFGEYRGTVKKIGLRASLIETLERKDIIIPNSHLVNERVTNWSSTRKTTRFEVSVGVAYGTDTALVRKLLLEASSNTSGILKSPAPFIRFENFGNSSLDFSVFFFSERVRIIENVKSNLRLEIDRLFRENEVSIPFPQSDIWVKSIPK